MDTHKELLEDLRGDERETNTELKRLKKEAKFFETNDVCPTCTQEIGDGFKESRMSSLTKQGVKLTKTVKKYKESIKEAVDKLNEYETFSSELYELRSEISSIEREIVRIEKENLQIEKELKELDVNTPNIDKEKKILDDLSLIHI